MRDMTDRYREIDIARGIGIILVILGHALKQIETGDTVVPAVIDVIYSFHMELFFILAGFVSIKVLDLDRNGRHKFIKGRAIRLLIPYFVMSVIYIPIKMAMSGYAIKGYDYHSAWRILIGDSPNTTMWFLYTLFLCSVVASLVANWKNINIVLVISFVVSIVAFYAGWRFRLLTYFAYYVLGIVIRVRYDDIRPRLGAGICITSLILLAVIDAISIYTGRNIDCIVAPVSGSILVLCISNAMVGSNSSLIADALESAGNMSMDIYILSDPVITAVRILLWNMLGTPMYFAIAAIFLAGVLIPVGLSKAIVRRSKVLRLLLFGIKQ